MKIQQAIERIILSVDVVATFIKRISSKAYYTICGIDACCFITSWWGQEQLSKIEIIDRKFYETISAFAPQFADKLSSTPWKTLITALTILLLLALVIRLFYRKPALLVAHSTMGQDITQLNSKLTKEYHFKRINVEIVLDSHNVSSEQVIAAITEQDKKLAEIKAASWRSLVFYYGVAHTPLIFRLGYQIGQTKKIRFLHRFRPTEDAQEFCELPENDTDLAAFIKSDSYNEENLQVKSEELLVALASTYPIKSEDLLYIDSDKTMHRYIIQMDQSSMGFDFFSSYHKLRSYADRFTKDIRNCVKKYGITKIHLVLSSSVPFTFYLAQQMNTQQFPEIIVYHYDRGKYTWGIVIQEANANECVVWANGKKSASAGDPI